MLGLEGSGSEPGTIERVRSTLLSQGYASATVKCYGAALQRFQAWMERRGDRIEDASCESVFEFLTVCRHDDQAEADIPCQSRNMKAALKHLLSIFGKVDKVSPVDEGLLAFNEYMESTRGLAWATRLYRLRYTAEFLSYLSKRPGNTSATAITPQDVAQWMAKRVHDLKPGSANVVAGSLRSYLRYRELCGTAGGCSSSVVPTGPHWRLAAIPRHLDTVALGKLLGSFDQSATGRRDFAMALCMVEMGLRASEVAHLSLSDIDWHGATLTVRDSKACRDRILPLPQKAGEVIAEYLKSGRLSTDSRALFVRHSFPSGTPLVAELVRGAMRRAYARAGFPKEWTGTHLLRHTAATLMQQGGATLKAMADVLGHRSVDTTIVYTKVDVPALRKVALPWPEALK